jgi:hypothetical protein
MMISSLRGNGSFTVGDVHLARKARKSYES